MEGGGESASQPIVGLIEIQVVSGADVTRDPDGCDLACPFSNPERGVAESQQRSKSVRKLSGLIVFCTIVMVVEIVGGAKANSLAILADAAHMLTDIAGLAISLFAAWASGWEPTSRHSFGFSRLEVLGALLSLQLIWMISGMLMYEATHRILHKADMVNGKLMFMTAAFGFIVNLIMVMWLGHDHHHHPHGSCQHDHHHHHPHGSSQHNHDHHHHHHPHGSSQHEHHHHVHDGEEESCALTKGGEEKDVEDKIDPISSNDKPRILNINLQGAYLHIMADLIQSIGVMIAGAIIWAVPSLLVVDLISTLIFSVLVLATTVPLLRNILSVLMERVPYEIDLARVEDGITHIKGVQDIHDLHIWSITVGKSVMSCHVIPEPGVSSSELLIRIRDYCKTSHGIHHVTVQIE